MGAFAFDRVCWVGVGSTARAPYRGAALALLLALAGPCPAFALDSSQPATLDKIPLKLSRARSRRCGRGSTICAPADAKSSVEALKYAAAGGQSLAQWKLGRMYAQGQGVPHDDFQAYQYFDQLIQSYNETSRIDAISRPSPMPLWRLASIASTASPIPNCSPIPSARLRCFNMRRPISAIRTPSITWPHVYGRRAGLAKNNMRAARWLGLAAEKHHRPAQALLGHCCSSATACRASARAA